MLHETNIPNCAGPDRATRNPVFQLPNGSWDCHAHVFGPAQRFPFSAHRTYTPEDCTVDEYVELLGTLGFAHGVVVQGGAHGIDNSAMLNALSRWPEKLRGVAVLPPGTSQDELAQYDDAGVRGVRMSTVVGGGVGFEAIRALADETCELGWHLMLHFGSSAELVEVAPVLSSIRSHFILDHLARITGSEGNSAPAFKCVLDLLQTDRCWVKLASLYRLSGEPYPHSDMLPLVKRVIKERPDRIIWGTNWPHPIHKGPMPNDADLVDLIPLWVEDPQERHAMLVDNPRTLYA